MIGISSTVAIGWYAGVRVGTPVLLLSSLGYYMTTTVTVRIYSTHLRKQLLAEVFGGGDK
jgi:hypothetical protein